MSAEPVVKIAGSPMRMPNTPFTPKRDVKPASQEVPASAEPTSRNENDKLCSQCKTATVMPPATRCKPCHALYNRVYEAKKLMDEGSIEVWNKLDRDKKAEFINASKALTVDDLKAKLQVFVSKETEAKQSLSLRNTGNFLDSPDLAAKYKNKPKQLESIRAKAKRIICATRDCTLYEDPSLQSVCTAEETRIEKRKMDFSTEEHVPRLKKQRAESKANKIEAGAADSNKFDEKKTKKLNDWLDFLKTSKEGLENCEADIKEYGKFIPPIALDTLKEVQVMVKAKQAFCETLKENGECMDFPGLIQEMGAFKKSFNEKKGDMNHQLKSAKAASEGKASAKGKAGNKR